MTKFDAAVSSYSELKKRVVRLAAVEVAVAQAEDREVLSSLVQGQKSGFIGLCHLTGDTDRIVALLEDLGAEKSLFRLVPSSTPAEAAAKAVDAVRTAGASILVKGSLKSEYYLKAILDREKGIRSAPVLSNLSLFQMPSYPKLLAISDNAIIVNPSLEEKEHIILNTLPLWRALGIMPALVAVLAAVETVNPKMQATVDADMLAKKNAHGAMKGFIVEGPFGYDAAIDRASAESKGLSSSFVCGKPDLLLAPNLETANALGKCYKFHGNAIWGGLVLGARVPAVLNSRSDDADNRFRSLLLARIMAEYSEEA